MSPRSLAVGVGLCAALAGALLAAQAAPDAKPAAPAIEVLDDGFKAVLAPGAAVRKLESGLKFVEGPVWLDQAKCLLFSDIPADAIYRWEEGKGRSVFRQPSHNSNGNAVDREGRLLTCEHGSRSVTRTEKDGKVVTLAALYKAKKLNSPNDIVAKGDGTIWFTDPPYGIDPKAMEQPASCVYRLDADAKEPVAVVTDMSRPNGLCFSPDEKLLYVGDSGPLHHVRRFRVKADNTLEGGDVFVVVAPGVPDGIRMDKEGRLYSTAADGVHVFSPEGKPLGTFKTPETAANCAFGGKDHKTLFITASTGLYAVDLAVSGAK